MTWFNYKQKWKSRFALKIEIPTIKTESNRCVHIFCSLCTFSYQEDRFYRGWLSWLLSCTLLGGIFDRFRSHAHRTLDIILRSLRSFWVERFDLNQSVKIDSCRKTFLYQCESSTPNRLLPRSRRVKWPIANWSHTLLTPPACSI